jgi:hypothetical protein
MSQRISNSDDDITPVANPALKKILPRILRRSSSFGEAPMLIPKRRKATMKVEDKSGSRWFALILSGLLMFGNYYAFDLPAALNLPLMEYMVRI